MAVNLINSNDIEVTQTDENIQLELSDTSYENYVVDSMAGNEQNKAPSVKSVKDYVEDIYSTEEVKTNKVWIDGKDVYRTVYVKNNQAIQNQTLLPHGISNIDKVLPTTFGELWDASNNQSIHFPSTANNSNSDLGFRIDRTNIAFFGTDNWSANTNRIIYFVIEYTKTTD